MNAALPSKRQHCARRIGHHAVALLSVTVALAGPRPPAVLHLRALTRSHGTAREKTTAQGPESRLRSARAPWRSCDPACTFQGIPPPFWDIAQHSPITENIPQRPPRTETSAAARAVPRPARAVPAYDRACAQTVPHTRRHARQNRYAMSRIKGRLAPCFSNNPSRSTENTAQHTRYTTKTHRRTQFGSPP